MMDNNGFEQLEHRVEQAIAMIHDLKRQREDLTRQRQELQTQVDALEGSKSELQAEIELVRESTVGRDEYDARKREIERRVEDLLQRFGELDEAHED